MAVDIKGYCFVGLQQKRPGSSQEGPSKRVCRIVMLDHTYAISSAQEQQQEVRYSNTDYLSVLKGQCHNVFDHFYFVKTLYLGP